jgi:peptidoglycan/LPS O-acetylase OafA/YrhL
VSRSEITTTPDNHNGLPQARRADGHSRSHSLDGVRGCLALLVLVSHAVPSVPLLVLSQAAVCGFFVLSGLVLTWSWDGHYLRFLARRFIRLWPMYALCLAGGYAASGCPIAYTEFFWWPLPTPNNLAPVDPPSWSLSIEAWAMLAMPLFVWFGRGSLIRAEIGVLLCLAAALIDPHAVFGVFFVIGAWASRFKFRVAALEHPLPQWLGRISYPLYLSHWPILYYFPGPMIVRVLAAFALAQVLTMTIERWSIAASRTIAPSRDGLRQRTVLSVATAMRPVPKQSGGVSP